MRKEVIAIFSLLILVNNSSGQLFQGSDIVSDCKVQCSTLYLFDGEGKELEKTQGSGNLKGQGVKNVSQVQQVGSGCFTIYKGKDRKGERFVLSGNKKIDLEEEGVKTTRVRWVLSGEVFLKSKSAPGPSATTSSAKRRAACSGGSHWSAYFLSFSLVGSSSPLWDVGGRRGGLLCLLQRRRMWMWHLEVTGSHSFKRWSIATAIAAQMVHCSSF